MSNFKLNLPTDIPWERICVTEDMIDPIVCDERLPAKWQTSMAVFKYKPEAEYQMYPMYDLTYLKVTATITGYQPLDKEIQGRIDWDGVDVSTIEGLTGLLNAYNPCHGAILQVVVGPQGKKQKMPLKDYPFFMDFEPKKRELYELATDTKEKSSRSIESLNVTKSSGATQSLEVLDVDMGGGGFGMQSTYAGTGGGFSYSAPNGQWGTKRLNAEESMQSRSSDVGQEKRESFSFSTQLSQMYHLLDSYHLGTNRVVFFIQPRPHTLEEPSGFVRGPRPVDGIQEFFLVVAQPKGQDDFCISLRLDTSHLTKTPIMEFERKSAFTDLAIAIADLPTSNDTMESRQVRCVVDYLFGGDDIYYKHFLKKVTNSVIYSAPDGFEIQGFNNSVFTNQNGNSNVTLSPDRKLLTVFVEANSSVWLQDEGDGIFADCPDELDQITGRVERRLQVNLISTTPNKQVGEQESLMITTRGVCCCASEQEHKSMDEYVVSVKPIPYGMMTYLNPIKNLLDNNSKSDSYLNTRKSDSQEFDQLGTCKECENKILATQKPDAKYTIRQANELSGWIRTETIKSLNDPTVKLQKFEDTDFFAKQLEYKIVQSKKGRAFLSKSIVKDISKDVHPKLEKHFGKKCKEITRRDMLSLRGELLAKVTGMSKADTRKLKLNFLGVRFNAEKPKKGKNGDFTPHMEE
ncbi:MAG: hypothetical protein KA536_20005 [Saprospiraceae bacterium]|nr:hypothetical protein [Saprospiraceae bacterium]